LHFGGTRNGMIVSWPNGIKDQGKVRAQFHHCIDLAPTLLEVVGIAEPTVVNGYVQRPIEGTSFAYTFDSANAKAPPQPADSSIFRDAGQPRHIRQRLDGLCRHGRLPWETGGAAPGFGNDKWELYHLEEDFSQAVDLVEKEPAKLRALQDLFMAEAAKYNVLPLDDRFAERMDVTLRPSFFAGRDKVTFFRA
jgi:arylsulfatase A-like enzyme